MSAETELKPPKRHLREQLGEDWYGLLEPTLHSRALVELGEKLRGQKITPCWDQVFKAYELTPPQKVRVLILGQDPYPRPGQAMGLAFSSGDHTLPYSLKNIFEDLRLSDYDERTRRRVDLTDWAEQGVMLLNTCLTTAPGKPFAHRGWGWEVLIGATLRQIDALPQNIVVMVWGKPALHTIAGNMKARENRLFLSAAHPANERYQKGSYIGHRHFARADKWLESRGEAPIKWI